MDPPPGTSWAALLARVPQGAEVLDVGCASGSFAVALRRKGCRVTGIEPDAAAAAVARSRCDVLLEGEVETMLARGLLPAGAFDVVILADVLEHLVDPSAVLAQLRPVLRPGGFLLASLPNATHTAVVLEMARGRFPANPEGLLDRTHLHFFGEDSARALFAEAGYTATLVDRVRRAPAHTEFGTRLDDVPDEMLAFLDRNPNADTYQFILRADAAGASRQAAATPDAAAAPESPLRNALVREATELRDELRRYHEAAVARHDEVERLHAEIGRYHEAVTNRDRTLEAERAEHERASAALRAEQERIATALRAQEAALAELTHRRRDERATTRAVLRAVAPLAALRVLYVTDSYDAPFRYRCMNAVAQLRADGVAANVLHLEDPGLLPALHSYSVVVLFRLAWSARVEQLVGAARRQRATLVFDIDDLLFDADAYAQLPFLADLSPGQRLQYRNLLPRLRQTFEACDHFIGSTPILVERAAALGKDAFLHPNLLHPSWERMGPWLRAARRRFATAPVIAYLSGSNTHDRDLGLVSGALADLMHERVDVQLLLGGFVRLPFPLLPFGDRVRRLPYRHWRVYPWALAHARVLLAPAAVCGDFADAKSALKFFEAGIFDVPTIATPTATFRAAINDGDTGWLAGTPDEWAERLRAAIDPANAAAVGARARAAVLAHHTFAAHRGRLRDLLHPLVGSAPGPVPPRLPADPERRAGGVLRRQRWRASRMRLRAELLRGAGAHEAVTGVATGSAAVASPIESDAAERVLETIRIRGSDWLSERGPVIADLLADPAGVVQWTLVADLVRNGEELVASGRDPSLASAALGVPAAAYRWLVVRMACRAEHPGATAQCFWLPPSAAGFAEEHSVVWPITSDGETRTYVIDLAATTWPLAETVTRVRIDPLDGPGTVRLERVSLLADLGQLEPGGNLRTALGRHHLHGVGIECGALQNPMAVPSDARVLYVDRLTTAQAREHYPELAEQRLTAPLVVADLQRLPFADGALDFCIGNHLLEHARDPIGGLGELLRVVRPGGACFISVPDGQNPLDARRPVTPFAHLLADHEPGADRSREDAAHYEESVSAHPDMNAAERRQYADRLRAQGYSIHFHTFDEASYRELVVDACRRIGARVEEYARNPGSDFDEHVAVIRRLPPDAAHTEGRAEGAPAARPVDIVVPVYGAREETLACLASVRAHARGDWRLMVIDDASPDPALWPALEAVAAAEPRMRLLRNPENLGFVATVNRALGESEGRDVLLLNSDTVVAAEFLERLQASTYADSTTGIVSALSNNATICSVPEFCRPNPLPPGHTIDSFAALVARTSLHLRPELVTAVGFCMYVRAEVIARIGVMDVERFGRGYGEENDWCERALAAGFAIRLADDVFVWHAGEASFGADTAPLKTTNRDVLEGLHPGFFAKVARFIEANPLAPVHENLRLALRRGADVPALLVLLHASFDEPGGGTEHHVRELVQTLALPRVVVAVPSGDAIHVTEVCDGRLDGAVCYRFPLARPVERFMVERADVDATLQTIVRLFDVAAAHVHHLLFWPIRAWRTLRALGLPFAVSVHDFFPVCPSLNLIDVATERLCCAAPEGPPADPGVCLQHLCDKLGIAPPADPRAFVSEHRAELGACLAAAQAVVLPSESARARVTAVHALDARRLRVIPHGYAVDPAHQVPAAPAHDVPLRIAVLGNICEPVKGPGNHLALFARTRHLPVEWHVFGRTDLNGFDERLAALQLGDQLVLHGAYHRSRALELIGKARVALTVVAPAAPESYSFTLSETLLAGVPAIALDRGAVADRVRDSGAGVVVQSVEEMIATLERLVRDRTALAALQAAARRYRSATLDDMAMAYRPLCAELLRHARAGAPLSLAERQARFAAWTGRPQPTAPPTLPVLPHYSRWWYPYYLRVAPLVPARFRQWGRARVAASSWRPRVAYRFAPPDPQIVANDGLQLVRQSARGVMYRVVHADPFFLLPSRPFAPRSVRVIRFDMRHEARGSLFAQLYWTHGDDESFSEEKSMHIPLDSGTGEWREYMISIDDGERTRWDAGEAIHHLRFDPLNAPGTIELRDLEFCDASG
jgi:GT2 family glycosyltransferase/2-polyprenyl-3-methyl-5-hydroxy-6-metoxy-1,4-benzoquinol methylase/glycosyltransferase involved in cell wall biosynthesis